MKLLEKLSGLLEFLKADASLEGIQIRELYNVKALTTPIKTDVAAVGAEQIKAEKTTEELTAAIYIFTQNEKGGAHCLKTAEKICAAIQSWEGYGLADSLKIGGTSYNSSARAFEKKISLVLSQSKDDSGGGSSKDPVARILFDGVPVALGAKVALKQGSSGYKIKTFDTSVPVAVLGTDKEYEIAFVILSREENFSDDMLEQAERVQLEIDFGGYKEVYSQVALKKREISGSSSKYTFTSGVKETVIK